MKLELIKKDDPRLKEACEEIIDFENKEFYKDLINQIMGASLGQYAFAAAAPQFGINKRFILMISATEKKVKNKIELEQFQDNYEVTPYFNPKITLMKGLQYYYEACMSTGDVIGKVARPYYIELDYQDIDGNHLHRTAEDFEAIVFCHEIDHLDGIEFIDKAEDLIYDADLEKRIEVRHNFPKEIVSKNIEFIQDGINDRAKTKVYTKR
ncbi:MAG: hypothetical protein E7168_04930 [Firmicutes bacterium]|nr:hypothetical protein [Bacillota bacterium]